MPIPIIDSHIHLFLESHLDELAWNSPSNPLGSQHSVAEYRQATGSVSTNPSTPDTHYLKGFVFIETDRKSSAFERDWSAPLNEVSFLAQIAAGKLETGQGHESADRDLCLAIIAWAPVPAGPDALKEYMAMVRERMGTDELFKKVKGVRFLLQNKPPGTMLEDGFIRGVKWLGEQGLVFELGIDARQAGLWQLHEAVRFLELVSEGQQSVPNIVINHMCKPNLHINYPDHDLFTSCPDYAIWKRYIEALASFPSTYMKISGLFSEMPLLAPFTSEADEAKLIASVASETHVWIKAVQEAFGLHRIMFGSDWPVCNIRGGGNNIAWARWRKIAEECLKGLGLHDDEAHLREFWGGVADRAYGCLPADEQFRCEECDYAE